ncbi:hypothetical protein [Amycolatopsis sp. YIM 10]|uniref:hypothetical protein n=1 Tax=Amycolatopsis sp. YIM 10 TaxID=2653857 RepID=UPI001290850B|nr:hypothetical protein [Amycolatopsis sp. YIM 10]QFU94218.1 hypothetical protein YIM_45440 [Amycolatopsis sp. YIM 10]
MRIWPILCLVVLAGCTQAVPGTPALPPAPANLALVDVAATSDVLTASKSAMESVFSYDPASPGTQADAAAKLLTGAARTQVESMLGQVRQAGATVTTTAREAAVAELTPTSAKVLMMLDQTSTMPGSASPSTGGAAVLVTAQREGTTWRAADIVVNPALAPVPASPGGPVAEARDSALAAARTGLVAFMELDSTDVDGWYQRQLAISTEPLLSDIRASQQSSAEAVRSQGSKVTVAPDPAVAAKSATPDLVLGLAVVKTSVVSTASPQPAEKVVRVAFELARQPDGWKFRALSTVL